MRSAHKRRATNVSLDPALGEEARELKLNLSLEFGEYLAKLVREKRADQWREQNKKAIEGYAKFYEKHGIWDEDERCW